MDKVIWNGLHFDVYDKDSTMWSDIGGLYTFAGHGPGGWIVYYVGQTESFSQRMPNHERWTEAVQFGATHVHALVVPDQGIRDVIEAEMIADLQPKLNRQLK